MITKKNQLRYFFLVWVLVDLWIINQWIERRYAPRNIQDKKNNIGFLIMATGKYVDLANRLIESAEQHFCTAHKVTYFIFTDGEVPKKDTIVKVYQEQLGWPYDTMMRFHAYNKHKELFAKMDYIFACDADMLFVSDVGDEILSERVATQHSQLMFKRGIYETNPFSTACVNRWEGQHYFAGAFYGGTREEFFKLLKTTTDRIDTDLARGIIAQVHDESHLNRYFIDYEPTTILSPSYCHFEDWQSPYPKKLVAFERASHGKSGMRKPRALNPLDYFQKRLTEEIKKHESVQA